MSLPGWYPDPAGIPNRFRYWDGRGWSSDTTDDPAGAPAGAGGQGGSTGVGGAGTPPADKSRRRFGPVILALVALVVLVLVGVFVVRGLFDNRPIVDPGPLPSSTVSGWDDSSPTTPPETPTPTPTPSVSKPTPTPTPTEERPLQPCPEGDPRARQDHPADDRIHGGGLSFPKISGWKGLATPSAYSWAYDVAGQQKQLEPEWIASATVGALFTGAGFDEPRRSADLVMQCVITAGFYTDTAERTDLWSKAIMVDGRPGWSIRAEVRIDSPDVRADGDTVDVVIVDTGSPESLAMFVGAVSLGDDDLLATMNATIENLKAE